MYRLVELSSGSIHIDGVDISKIGLADLRNALAIIPQDPVSAILHYHSLNLSDGLFQLLCGCLLSFITVPDMCLSAVSGTLRTNLDPFGQHDDTKLWDALRRSYLIDNVKQASLPAPDETVDGQTSTNRFTLDTIIEDEGANLSLGQVCLSLYILISRQLTCS